MHKIHSRSKKNSLCLGQLPIQALFGTPLSTRQAKRGKRVITLQLCRITNNEAIIINVYMYRASRGMRVAHCV